MHLSRSAACVLLRQPCHDHKQLLNALVNPHILATFDHKSMLPTQHSAP
jgi:hypothetical protein